MRIPSLSPVYLMLTLTLLGTGCTVCSHSGPATLTNRPMAQASAPSAGTDCSCYACEERRWRFRGGWRSGFTNRGTAACVGQQPQGEMMAPPAVLEPSTAPNVPPTPQNVLDNDFPLDEIAPSDKPKRTPASDAPQLPFADSQENRNSRTKFDEITVDLDDSNVDSDYYDLSKENVLGSQAATQKSATLKEKYYNPPTGWEFDAESPDLQDNLPNYSAPVRIRSQRNDAPAKPSTPEPSILQGDDDDEQAMPATKKTSVKYLDAINRVVRKHKRIVNEFVELPAVQTQVAPGSSVIPFASRPQNTGQSNGKKKRKLIQNPFTKRQEPQIADAQDPVKEVADAATPPQAISINSPKTVTAPAVATRQRVLDESELEHSILNASDFVKPIILKAKRKAAKQKMEQQSNDSVVSNRDDNELRQIAGAKQPAPPSAAKPIVEFGQIKSLPEFPQTQLAPVNTDNTIKTPFSPLPAFEDNEAQPVTTKSSVPMHQVSSQQKIVLIEPLPKAVTQPSNSPILRLKAYASQDGTKKGMPPVATIKPASNAKIRYVVPEGNEYPTTNENPDERNFKLRPAKKQPIFDYDHAEKAVHGVSKLPPTSDTPTTVDR